MGETIFTYNTLIVLAGTSVLGAAAGLVGSLAVLRGRALTGDALAHATLPGICLAFLVLQQRMLTGLLLGALISGLLGVGVIAALRRWTRIKEDAAIGIVLSVFFGAGIVLSRIAQNQYSAGSKAGLDSYILGKTAGMIAQDVALIGAVAGLALAIVVLLYKEFKIVIFDTGFAQSQGWPVLGVDLLLMTLIAAIVVIGLPAVGVILVSALIVLPGTTARFWTARLDRVLVLSALIGLMIGGLGTMVSAHFALLPAGPIIVLVGSLLFVISLLCAPREGLIARWIAQRRFRTELDLRKLLLDLYESPSVGEKTAPFSQLQAERFTTPRIASAIQSAEREGYIERSPTGLFNLTAAGRARALAICRGRRLWQVYLTEYPESASAIADLGSESVVGIVPDATIDTLIRKLKAEDRWPEPELTSAARVTP